MVVRNLQTYMLLDAVVLMGFGAVLTCWYLPTFRRNILSASSALKMETVSLVETLTSLHGAKTQKNTALKTPNLKNSVRLNLSTGQGQGQGQDQASGI
jgi:hypothetical protein